MTKSLTFTNPATGNTFGEVEMTSTEEVQKIVEKARQAFPAWRAKSVKERIRILRAFQGVLIDRRDEITEVLNRDCGKSRQDGLIELFVTVDMLAQYNVKAPKWLKPERVSSGLYVTKRSVVEHRPHGVTAVISPWNYPLTLSLPPMLAALLAGNTVVLKPSEVTAATGVLIEQLIKEVPELAPFAHVVHGDGRVGAALTQASPDFIFMTGSTATGRKIMKTAAESLTPVSLELGGKDAMIVLADADLEAAARWGAWGAFFNTGQTCMAVERAYVLESQYEAFVRLAVENTENLTTGYTTDLNSSFFMGPITDPRQVQIIERHLEDALAKGATLLTGGKKEGMFFDPMVLVDVDHSMLVMREESFGPFLPIMKVKDEAEAIELANDSRYGLGASIWSRDTDHAKHVADQVQAGSVIINDCIAQFGIPMLPFGGVKDSGFGRTHGREGLMQFTRPYSYAIGAPPFKWDIATILRESGKYDLATAILGGIYGTSLRQRWETISQWLRRKRD